MGASCDKVAIVQICHNVGRNCLCSLPPVAIHKNNRPITPNEAALAIL